MSLPDVAQVVGLAGHALALAAGAACLAARLSRQRCWPGAAALVAAAVATGIHVDGIPLAGYPRGMLGDLSVTSMVLLAAALSAALTGRRAVDAPSRTALFAWAVAAGLVLYPLTLGLTRVDPYELGYRPRLLVVLAAGLAASWWWRRRGAALVLAAGVGAFQLRALESVNLWDYLLDPALVLWAAAALIARAITSRRAPSARPAAAPLPERPPPPRP